MTRRILLGFLAAVSMPALLVVASDIRPPGGGGGAGTSQWYKYSLVAIANGVNGCANANGCWQVNGVLGANKAAGLTQDVVLFQLTANAKVTDWRMKTAVACTGTATAVSGFGVTANNVLFRAASYDIQAAPAATNLVEGPTAGAGGGTSAATNVVASLVTTVNNVELLAAGCAVDYYVYAMGLSGGGSGGISVITFASIPATCADGSTFYLSDSLYTVVCNPANTFNYFLEQRLVTPPPSAGWSWDNQGAATVSSTHGYEYLVLPFAGAPEVRARYRNQPATPYTIKAALMYSCVGELTQTGSGVECHSGIGFREAVSGKIFFFNIGPGGSWSSYVTTSRWIDSVTPDAPWIPYEFGNMTNGLSYNRPFGVVWLAMRNTGTDLYFYLSLDGLNWEQFGASYAVGTFFTTAPDQVLVGSMVNGTPAVVSVLGWSVSDGTLAP